ncbi:hypothetical protein O7622_22490 [Micromonospora sp. WMMD1076]|nr:hypothetical protein [Micromonospora sp. WMMD1076]WFF05814.1 hypothetical protein O7622_22490 [Micromonospora sp. WMMD1076]
MVADFRLPPLVSVALLDVVLVALVVRLVRVHRRLAGTPVRADGAPGR